MSVQMIGQVTVVPVKNGGTGISTYTIGDIIYASAPTTFSKLPIGTSAQVLSVSGGVPTWTTLAAPVSLSFNSPLSVTSNTVSISQANGSTNGYLSSTDWNHFNSYFLPLSGGTMTGNILFNSGTKTIRLDYGSDNNSLNLYNNGLSLSSYNDISSYSSSLEFTTSSTDNDVVINSANPTFKGIQENSDYSPNYSSLSLINKGYAQSMFAPISYSTAVTSATAPLSITTNTISIPAATSSVNGYLTSTNWNTFKGKNDSLHGTGFVKIAGNNSTISYDNSTYLTGNQSITFTPSASGDVTGSATGSTSLSPTLTIGAGKVTNTMLAGSISVANTLLSVSAPITLTTNTLALTSTGTNSVVLSTGATLTTPTLGVASATSLAITGAGGAGFVSLTTQTATPSAPSAGTRIFSNSNNKLSWVGSANNYMKTFDGGLATADRVYSLPNRNVMVDSLTTSTSTALSGLVSADGANLKTATIGSGLTLATNTLSINAAQPTITTATALASVGTLTTGVWNGTAIGTSYLPASQSQLTTATNLTSVGTLTTGTWNATKIGLAYGGTNSDLSASGAVGDLIQGATSTTFQRLAAGAVGTILRSTGTGSLTAFTTATYPNTITANQVMYGSATNAMGGSANLTFDGQSFVQTITDRTRVSKFYQNQNTAPTNVPALSCDVASSTTSAIHSNIVCFSNSYGTPSTGFGASILFQGLQEVSGATTLGFGRIGGNWTGSSGNNGRIFLSTNSNSSTVFTDGLSLSSTGVFIGTQTNTTVATAQLHIAAGTASASTAPLKFTSGTSNTTAEAGTFEYDGTYFYGTPSGTTRKKIMVGLVGTATLDFGATAAQSSSDLTITVTGAADGDLIQLGTPNAATLTNSSYNAWVSASNTVTVRFNNYSTGSQNPASASFNVSVIKP